MKSYDLIVAGGGASGLCASIAAAHASSGASIALVEALPRVGKKILATGNGKCNLTNLAACAEKYNNPGFVRPALERYGVSDTLQFFESLGLMTISDSEGRVYPMSGTASSVCDALRFEVQRLEIDILCDTPITSLKYSDGFFLNEKLFCRRLILAFGGKASPQHGSNGSGYSLLRALGHTVTALSPALVQLRTKTDFVKQLKGIRCNAKIEIYGERLLASAIGELLFTDYGISGIAAMETARAAALCISHGKPCRAQLDLLPCLTHEQIERYISLRLQSNPSLPLGEMLFGVLPKRLGQVLCAESTGLSPSLAISSLTDRHITKLATALKCMTLTVTGTNGFESAQVTAGGAELSQFDSHTLQSKLVPGLYVCGELLDIDGTCGGYNLQWAWSSGRLAGASAATDCQTDMKGLPKQAKKK